MISKIDIASRNWAEDYITQHGRRFNNMLRESFIAGFQKGVSLSTESSKWIDQDEGALFPIECLRCHKEPLLDEYGNYVYSAFCPSCGARMKGTDHKTENSSEKPNNSKERSSE